MMKKIFLCTYFSLFINTAAHAMEYIYPVAYCKKTNTTLLIHQDLLKRLRLLFFHHYDNHYEEGLWSLFNPINVQLLPDESGFSFIDNGRLRIKYFNKRSAKTIEFDRYLHNLHSVQWLEDQRYIFSAKQIDYHSIFIGTTDGNTQCVVMHNYANCVYPQIINKILFYIQEESYKNSIKSQKFIDSDEQIMSLIDFDNRILFLNMISEHEGFVVEYVKADHSPSQNILFYYTRITYVDEKWLSQRLFSFYIPYHLLSPRHEESLNESLTPLVPRIIGNKIYFVSASLITDDVQSYTFDMTTKKIERNGTINDNYFVPVLAKDTLIFGGRINHINDIAIRPF